MNGDRLVHFRTQLERKRGQQTQVKKNASEVSLSITKGIRKLKNVDEAQIIIQKVAQQTQQSFRYHISELVSLALASVFDDAYKLELEFVIKRGKTEAEIYFSRRGEKIDPLQASGGGPVDIASFALRIALWNLVRPRSRAVILLDEPFRFISRDLQPKAGAMLKMLSEKLKLQIIMVTHNQHLIELADKIFEVRIEQKGVSRIVVNK